MSEQIRLFDDRQRRELLQQRVVVLDGALDDDNGVLLTSQLVALAAEDPGRTSPCGCTPPAARCRRCWRSGT
ncbi:ATP-dependent Clp protease proteolytic subunit [Nocardioides sambongensis]|uniref:ATP-dependent Clp protease proteolytic subunit n=1 Tax=Nocardioides sambongensis TaxID=2589074 RepID=UPI001E47EA17|nr:ATP-dependent Clp protease proteolytic subunit [Nocardioides sambongensis]